MGGDMNKIVTWVGGVLSALVVLGIVALFSLGNDVAKLQTNVENMVRNLEANQRDNARRLERLEDWQRVVNARQGPQQP
jgi:glucose-6-phosphate isomerase